MDEMIGKNSKGMTLGDFVEGSGMESMIDGKTNRLFDQYVIPGIKGLAEKVARETVTKEFVGAIREQVREELQYLASIDSKLITQKQALLDQKLAQVELLNSMLKDVAEDRGMKVDPTKPNEENVPPADPKEEKS